MTRKVDGHSDRSRRASQGPLTTGPTIAGGAAVDSL